jgi:hypothetical protein
MLGLLLALVLASSPRAEDARTPVLVLPPSALGGVSSQRTAQLSAAIEAAVEAEPGFRLAAPVPALEAALTSDPGCREQPACLRGLLEGRASLAVDARISPHGGGLALELRLLDGGGLVARQAAVTSVGGMAGAARRELATLLAGRSPELWLYQQARAGDSQAAERLEAQFPGSPWLMALQEMDRRSPPPASAMPRPGATVAAPTSEPRPAPVVQAVAELGRAAPAAAAPVAVAPPAPAAVAPVAVAPPAPAAAAPVAVAPPAPLPAMIAPPEPAFTFDPEPQPTTAPQPVAAPEPVAATSGRSFVASTAAAPGGDRPVAVTPTPKEQPEAPPGHTSGSIDASRVPKDMRAGSDDTRYRALELAEQRPDLTDAIVWVLQHDPNDEVRRKAWRVIRARWRKDVGSRASNQAAAIWVFEHRPTERAEAAWAIAQYGLSVFEGRDMLAMFDAALIQPYGAQAYDLAAAALVLGARTHRLAQARMVVEEAIEQERDAMRRRQLKRALMQHGGR